MSSWNCLLIQTLWCWCSLAGCPRAVPGLFNLIPPSGSPLVEAAGAPAGASFGQGVRPRSVILHTLPTPRTWPPRVASLSMGFCRQPFLYVQYHSAINGAIISWPLELAILGLNQSDVHGKSCPIWIRNHIYQHRPQHDWNGHEVALEWRQSEEQLGLTCQTRLYCTCLAGYSGFLQGQRLVLMLCGCSTRGKRAPRGWKKPKGFSMNLTVLSSDLQPGGHRPTSPVNASQHDQPNREYCALHFLKPVSHHRRRSNVTIQ